MVFELKKIIEQVKRISKRDREAQGAMGEPSHKWIR